MAFQQYFISRNALEEERRSLSECRTIAQQLKQLATRPRLASVESATSESGAKQINVAIANAGIASTSVRSVSPSPAMRLGGSDYQQRETTVNLANVSLMQIVVFEQGLNAGLGVTLSKLALSIPENASSVSTQTELWDASLTLTQIIYSPKSPK
jgi:hypothetical protein